MTTATQDPEPQVEEEATPESKAESTATVAVDINRLIVGREVSFPIYDDREVLLLAAGKTITSEILNGLRDRDVSQVSIHEQDVANTTLQRTDSAETAEEGMVQFDETVARKLDLIIDSGLIDIDNDGPALRDSAEEHGAEGYDEEFHASKAEEHNAACDALSELLRDVVHGGNVSGEMIVKMTSPILEGLVKDKDSMVSVALEACHDHALADHSLKTALLAMAVGIEMELTEENVRDIGAIGLVQDWGMAQVPKDVREREGKLDIGDVIAIQKHPMYSLEMLQNVSGIPRMTSIVAYQVHERPNGSGYPRGREGQYIHQFSKIIGVADAYVAMTSQRPYRRPLMPYAAMECLIRQSSTNMVDPEVVRALLRVQSLFPIGSYVTLSDGSVARVIRCNRERYTTPIVQLINEGGQPKDPEAEAEILDLSDNDRTILQVLPTPDRDEIHYSADFMVPSTVES